MRKISFLFIASVFSLLTLANTPAGTQKSDDTKNSPAVSTKQIDPAKFPQRIDALKDEKKYLCSQFADYRKTVRGRNKKKKVLSSIGYYPPSMIHGHDRLKAMADQFYDRVDNEIDLVNACAVLDQNTAKTYVGQLQKLEKQVRAKFNSIPEMGPGRIR